MRLDQVYAPAGFGEILPELRRIAKGTRNSI
jgi:hypothetical protein